MIIYASDVAALRAVAMTALSLGENDVLDIGALDPQEYDETALNVSNDEQVLIAWVRWGKGDATTAGVAMGWVETYSVSVRVDSPLTFGDSLASARTLRTALDGLHYRATDHADNVRTISVTDAVPGFTDNFDLKTIQIFIDIQ